jgi:hypothetical protein
LCKGGKLQIISFTGEERDVFSFYALKMLWEVRYFPPCLVILEFVFVNFLYIIKKERLDEWFATHNSVCRKVLVTFFLQNRGDVYCSASEVQWRNIRWTYIQSEWGKWEIFKNVSQESQSERPTLRICCK